jgi:hypothetical protein
MKDRPKKSIWLSLYFAGFLALLTFGMAPTLADQFAHTPWKVSFLGWPLLAALLLWSSLNAWQTSAWVLVSFPLSAILLLTLASQFGLDLTESTLHPVLGWLLSSHLLGLIFVAGVVGQLDRDLLIVLFNPSLRWWQTPKRLPANFTAKVSLLPDTRGLELFKGKTDFYTKLINISETGALLHFDLENGQPARLRRLGVESHVQCSRLDLRPGTRCEVFLSVDGIDQLVCTAEVVRHSASKESPSGSVGVRFSSLSKEDSKGLKRLIGGLEILAQT